MVGTTELSLLLSSIKVSMDIAKGAKAAIDALGDAEAKFKIAELYSALSEIKIAAADAQEKSAEKDREIERLKGAFKTREESTVKVGSYRYRKGPSGEPLGYPYCPRCEEMDGVFMALQPAVGGHKMCPNCKTQYGRLTIYMDQPAPGA